MGQPQWTRPENIDLSLQTIEAMAIRYGNRSSLMGIELLNEPSQWFSEANHTALKDYYEKSYHIIRSYNPQTLVIFNELYSHIYSWWNGALLEPHFYNVVMDIHLYDWFQRPKDNGALHLKAAKAWGSVIQHFSQYHPIIVGEWCMSTGIYIPQVGQSFVDASMRSFQSAVGWYMWTWRLQRQVGFDEWDVKYQAGLPHGLSPFKNFLPQDRMVLEDEVNSVLPTIRH